MLKIRQLQDCLILNMGIPILLRQHLYIETAPLLSTLLSQQLCNFVTYGKRTSSPGKPQKFNMCRCKIVDRREIFKSIPNSLWPSDALWRHRSVSLLVLIISKGTKPSPEQMLINRQWGLVCVISQEMIETSILDMSLKIIIQDYNFISHGTMS